MDDEIRFSNKKQSARTSSAWRYPPPLELDEDDVAIQLHGHAIGRYTIAAAISDEDDPAWSNAVRIVEERGY